MKATKAINKIKLFAFIIIFASCQRCWECETQTTYRYKDTGEIWTVTNTQSYTCVKEDKKEMHNKTKHIETAKYNVEMYGKCKVKWN